MNFLTAQLSTNETDEQFVVTQIRKHLATTQNAEVALRFDSLYSSLQKSVSLYK